MGIASLVLGIIAFIIAITLVLAPLGVILAVVGLILGIVDTVKKGKAGQKKVISIVGLVLCSVMFIVLIIESFFVVLGLAVAGEAIKDLDTNEKIVDSLNTSVIDSFNAKFESYEGSQSGTSVRILLNSVSNSNYANSNHQVDVYYNGNKENSSSLRSNILSSKSYKVSFYKDLDGYINRIYITSETTTLDDTNNTIGTNNIIDPVTNSTSNNTTTNTTNTTSSGNSTTTTATATGKTSSKQKPLSLNEWGIASQYSSGKYIDVPVRVTKITRGATAAGQVKAYCEDGSIYKYSEPKTNMEWAVIEYEVDLTKIKENVNVSLSADISGTGDGLSIKYNGASYYTTTMNMTHEYTNSKIANAKFAAQLPTGCSDYIISLGYYGHTQAYFSGK